MQIHIHAAHVTIGAAAALSADFVAGEAIIGSVEPGLASGVPAVGCAWPEQGGINAGFMPPEDGQPGYWLIVPTDAQAESPNELKWGKSGTTINGLSARDGKANTAILAAGAHPAATFCAGLQLHGFDDYYLPSRREASLLAATVPHLFKSGWHWTSSQYAADNAFVQDFSVGGQGNDDKDNEWRVRAVRRFITP